MLFTTLFSLIAAVIEKAVIASLVMLFPLLLIVGRQMTLKPEDRRQKTISPKVWKILVVAWIVLIVLLSIPLFFGSIEQFSARFSYLGNPQVWL